MALVIGLGLLKSQWISILTDSMCCYFCRGCPPKDIKTYPYNL